jgi:hypothetical protein
MTNLISLPLETAQHLELQAYALNHALYQAYLEQSAITLAAVPFKERWEKEYAHLQRISRILDKNARRIKRRAGIVHRFFI